MDCTGGKRGSGGGFEVVIEETKSVGVRRRTEAGVCVLKKRLELRKLKKEFTAKAQRSQRDGEELVKSVERDGQGRRGRDQRLRTQ